MSILNYIEKMKEMYEGERITAQGPRTGFKEGNGVYDEKDLLGKRVRELMDEGYDFGEAVRQAMKEGYAEGGRIELGGGGFLFTTIRLLYKGKPGLQVGRIEKELLRKYRAEGMELGSAIGKANDEAFRIVDDRKLKIVEDAMTKVDMGSDDYIKLMDEKLRIDDYEMYTDIKRWENTRPDLADKTRALHFPEWAEARFGENFDEVLQNRQAQALKEKSDEIDRMYPDKSDTDILVDEIDEMNKANIAEVIEGKKKHAIGGRVGYNDGQLVRNTVDGSRPGYKGLKPDEAKTKILNFLKNKKEIRSTVLSKKLADLGYKNPPSALNDLKNKQWFKDLNIKFIQDPNPMLTGEIRRGAIDLSKGQLTVANKYAKYLNSFDKDSKYYVSADDWKNLASKDRQKITNIMGNNEGKFVKNFSRQLRFSTANEKKLMDAFGLTAEDFKEHGKFGVPRNHPEYNHIFRFTEKGFKFTTVDLLNSRTRNNVMANFELPEGVKKWDFDRYRYGIPGTAKENRNLARRITTFVNEKKPFEIASDWSTAKGWMTESMNRVYKNQTEIVDGVRVPKKGVKLTYEPVYDKVNGKKIIVGFKDNTKAGKGNTFYSLKKYNNKFKGTDWTNHGDHARIQKFVDISKRSFNEPNEVITGLLKKGGITQNIRLNDVLSYLAKRTPKEALKNAIVKHHISGVGAKGTIGNATQDIQLLETTVNQQSKAIEARIRSGNILPGDEATLKNLGAYVRHEGKLYGSGAKSAIGQFKAIEKGAETSIRNWNKKDFNEFNKYLQSFCGYGKSTGGRIGFKSGSCSPEVAKRNFLIATNDVRTGRVTGEAAEQIAKNAGKVVAKAGSKSALASIFGPAGIGIDIAYEVGSIGLDVAYGGKSWNRALQDNWITGAFIYGTGQEEFHKELYPKDSKAKPYGQALDLMEVYNKAQKNIDRIKQGTYRSQLQKEEAIRVAERDLKGIEAQYNALTKNGKIMEEGSNEYENYMAAKTEFEDTAKAKSFGAEAGLKYQLDTPESDRAVPYKKGEPVKIDFNLPENYATFKADLPTKEKVIEYFKEQGYNISPQEADEIIIGEKWRQEFEQPGIRGTQDWRGANGGRAGYMGGGIAAIRKPHAIPPKRQGLRSIMINVNDD